MDDRPANVRRMIAREMATFLRHTRIDLVYFAQSGFPPPPLAYVTSFPRLTILLDGSHPMQVAGDDGFTPMVLTRGQVLFVGRNCWNKPDWSAPVKLLTLLFGKKQIGISLVKHDGRENEPVAALKATFSSFEGPLRDILNALTASAHHPRREWLAPLLVEALLHAGLELLDEPRPMQPRKAARTYEAICLYVQENFQQSLTRERVADNFGLTPNHVSRLFRREGSMRFSDYLTLVRIDRAKFMLREYGSPLKEIAARCGYADAAYFCRVFRRITKITPTAYRLKGL